MHRSLARQGHTHVFSLQPPVALKGKALNAVTNDRSSRPPRPSFVRIPCDPRGAAALPGLEPRLPTAPAVKVPQMPRGFRATLPSDPGRPAAPLAGTTTAKEAVVLPDRNADGRFPCPFCENHYARQLGLKQHIRRRKISAPIHQDIQPHSDFSADTGDRPYRCSKCDAAFARSDVLKSHAAKCC